VIAYRWVWGPCVRPQRKIYGSSFAAGAGDHEKLGDILHKLDETSLTKLVEEHERLQRR
jgi:hypothetical protein